MNELIIRAITSSDPIPWDLLLLADPSREATQQYIDRGEIFLAFIDDSLVGVSVVIWKSDKIAELKNVAVFEKYRGKGIGKQLVFHAIEWARSNKALRIEVGTGNSSHLQLALYKKCGFIIIGVDKDFFVKNYKEKIFENGIQCVDMIRLSLDLK